LDVESFALPASSKIDMVDSQLVSCSGYQQRVLATLGSHLWRPCAQTLSQTHASAAAILIDELNARLF
jgi:hypothetical protein